MKRVDSRLLVWLAALVVGCITPAGYDRPDGGESATGSGGASPATGGSATGGSATGGAASGGSTGTAGGGGSGVISGTGGATGKGGAIGSGGSATSTGGTTTTGSGGSTTGAGGTSTTGAGGTTTTGAGGAAGAGTVLYQDDFESDTVGSQANHWIQDTTDSDATAGTWTVVSDSGNQALQGAASGSDFTIDIGGDSTWTNYTLQADIKVTSGSSFEVGLFGRFALGSDKGDYYETYMDDSGAVQLRVKLNGSTTTLGTKSKSTTGDAQLNTVYTLVLDMHGSTISVSVNGVPRISMVMDTTLTTGGIGLIINNGTAEFDNILVTQ